MRTARITLTLAGTIVFLHTEAERGGGGWCDPLAVWPLVELEIRGKDKRVGRYETQRLIPKFKVSGQSVTSQVRSMTQMSGLGF